MFLLFPARSPLNMSLRRLANAAGSVSTCAPCAPCAPPVQTPHCERRRVGIKRVPRHMPILRLCVHSAQTAGKPACLSVGAVSGGHSLACLPSRCLHRSPANQPTGRRVFTPFWWLFKTFFCFLFLSQTEIVLMKCVPRSFL